MRSFRDRWFSRQHLLMGCGLATALAMGVVLGVAWTTPDAEAQAPERVFTGGSGMILSYIKAEATGDFEAVLRRVGEALRNSDNPDRRRQAETWKVYRAKEAGQGGSVLYIMFMDPVVPGGNYATAGILYEAFPTEVQELYERYNAAYAAGGQIPLNLDLVMEF
jgi:hypothetical protein